MPRVRKPEVNRPREVNERLRDHSKNAIINVSVVWGTRRLQLDARFGGVVFLGAALLVLVAILFLNERLPHR